MKKASQFGIFSVADSMQAAASALDVPLHVVKEMKKSGCVAFRGSRIHLRELAEAILSAEEPSTVLFPVPVSEKCDPKAIQNFQGLLRTALGAHWLAPSEILETLLVDVVAAMAYKKFPPNDADKFASTIQIGFGTAVLVLEPAVLDQFLKKSATMLSESVSKMRTRKLPRVARSTNQTGSNKVEFL